VPRKTAENTVKHRDDGVGSVVANHRGGGEISMVVTTLDLTELLSRVWCLFGGDTVYNFYGMLLSYVFS